MLVMVVLVVCPFWGRLIYAFCLRTSPHIDTINGTTTISPNTPTMILSCSSYISPLMISADSVAMAIIVKATANNLLNSFCIFIRFRFAYLCSCSFAHEYIHTRLAEHGCMHALHMIVFTIKAVKIVLGRPVVW